MLSDFRHAFRVYARTPGASLLAAAVLAVSMGFVASFLSLFADLALKPFPGIEDSSGLVTIAQVNEAQSNSIRFAFTERLAEDVTALQAVVGVSLEIFSPMSSSERLLMEHGSRGFFDVIRPKLVLGRGFDDVEHYGDAEPVVVISDRYWRERFDASSNVIGQTISLVPQGGEQSTEFRVIGVMHADMRGLFNDDVVFWTPMEQVFAITSVAPDQRFAYPVGRLRPGVSVKNLVREIETRFPNAADEFRLGSGFRIGAIAGIVRDIASRRFERFGPVNYRTEPRKPSVFSLKQ